MFGLIHRGQLTSHVASEFENFMARLKALWLTEHNEDGSHGDIQPSSVTLHNATVGDIVNLEYDANRFWNSDSGAWTVSEDNQLHLRVSRVGQLALVQFLLVTTEIDTDTQDTLYIRLPELHGIPTRSSTGSVYDSVCGHFTWSCTASGPTAYNSIGVVNAYVQDLGGAYPPSTSLALTAIKDGTSDPGMFKSFPICSDLTINGYAWIMLMPDNVPVIYNG